MSSDFIVVVEIFFNQEKVINPTGSGNLMLSFFPYDKKKTNKKNTHTHTQKKDAVGQILDATLF